MAVDSGRPVSTFFFRSSVIMRSLLLPTCLHWMSRTLVMDRPALSIVPS
jgi:hypothetical protein